MPDMGKCYVIVSQDNHITIRRKKQAIFLEANYHTRKNTTFLKKAWRKQDSSKIEHIAVETVDVSGSITNLDGIKHIIRPNYKNTTEIQEGNFTKFLNFLQ